LRSWGVRKAHTNLRVHVFGVGSLHINAINENPALRGVEEALDKLNDRALAAYRGCVRPGGE
jgi:hypothetical protein